MALTIKHKGMLLAFSQSFLWSLLPVLVLLGYKSVDPFFSLAVVTTVAALFFSFVLTIRGDWREIFLPVALPYILVNTLLNAFLYFGLVFWGTSFTSAGNVAIILRMENFFSIVLLGGSGFDKIGRKEVMGGFLMIIGAMIVLFPGTLQFNKGDLIILFASCLPVLGNVCSKKARVHVGSATIMFVRSSIAAILFWGIAFGNGSIPQITLPWSTIVALVLNGFVVMGIARMLWIEAIHLIPISTANSIGSVGPFCTLLIAYLVLGQQPTLWQLSAAVPMVVGLNLLLSSGRSS